MLLRNYYNLMAAMTLGVTQTSSTQFGEGYISFKRTDGSMYSLNTSLLVKGAGLGFAVGTTTSCGNDAGVIVFGTGTTPVTFDDYKLDVYANGINKSSFAVSAPVYDSVSHKWTASLSCIISNTSGADITITEVGIEQKINYGNLVYREVLSTPITLAAGETVNYTQNLEYQMPTV